MSARTLLDRGAARLSSELEDQPLVLAEMLDKIGQVYTNLTLYAEAETLLTRAVSLRRSALGRCMKTWPKA